MYNRLALNSPIIDLNLIYETHQILIDKVDDLEKKINTIKDLWIPISEIARVKQLSKDAVRKQLNNGNFEEGVDFKHDGGKILVHQGAIEQIRRQRRSNNG